MGLLNLGKKKSGEVPLPGKKAPIPLPGKKAAIPLPSKQAKQQPVTTPIDTRMAEAVEIFRRYGRLYSLRFGYLPRQKTVEDSTRQKMTREVDTDKRQLSISKKLLPDDARISSLSSGQTLVREAFEKRTHPYPIDGIRLFVFDTTKLDIEQLSTEEIEKELALQRESFETEIKSHIDNYYKRVEDLATAWPEVITKARLTLRETFNEADYLTADELRARLRVDFGAEGLISVSGPEAAHMTPAAQAAEQARIRQRFEDAIKMQEEFMLSAFSSAIDNLLESVQKKDVGETRSFKSTRIQHVFDCFADFRQKCLRYGILQGTALQEEIEKAQQVLKYGAEQPEALQSKITKDADIRRTVIEQLKTVSDSVAKIVSVESQRANRRNVLVDS